MLKKLFQKKIFRFIICGAITAAFNIVLIYSMIEYLKLNTPLLRNVANILSLEVSLVFSFFVYKVWVWSGSPWKIKEVLLRQMPLYHLSVFACVITRSCVLFPILDWIKINYLVNTLIGILIGSIINYLMSDKFVFKTN
ncbi:polysaccharide synthesis protein GtrA [Nostocales cyanobacterium HT-58-2]|nr:polysaccharide synthesis protein GtrA [Nostocales cyanobacterium HT-58-2]